MKNWEKVILQFIRTLKELRQCAGLESVTKVGSRTVYRVDSNGLTSSLVRIENLLKYITEQYLAIEESEIMTVTAVYSPDDVKEYYKKHGIEHTPLTEEEIKEMEECVADAQD